MKNKVDFQLTVCFSCTGVISYINTYNYCFLWLMVSLFWLITLFFAVIYFFLWFQRPISIGSGYIPRCIALCQIFSSTLIQLGIYYWCDANQAYICKSVLSHSKHLPRKYVSFFKLFIFFFSSLLAHVSAWCELKDLYSWFLIQVLQWAPT